MTSVCGICGGTLTAPVKRKCVMESVERGWDYWVECLKCKRGFFGYQLEDATKRCEQGK